PAVERLELAFGDQVIEASAGDVVRVPRDETLRLTVLFTEDDLDAYEATVGGQRVLFSDDLSAQWWFDQEVERSDALPGSLTAELRAGRASGVVRAYAVVRDGLGGEGWGFVALDFGG
ncbi:MAG: hypothetical protein KDK70_40975, partial [Myxococcales bacterium]|nr:hypothetical protein [Myxococcales bacterium]